MGPNRQRKEKDSASGRCRGRGRGDGTTPESQAPPSMLSRAGRDMIIDVLHHAATGGAVPVPERHFDANADTRITFHRNVRLTPSEILQKVYDGLGFPSDLTTQYVTELIGESRLPSFTTISELLEENGACQKFLVDSCFELFSYMLCYSREDLDVGLTPEQGDKILEEEIDTIRVLFDDSFLGIKNFSDDDIDDRELYMMFRTMDEKHIVVCVKIPDHYPTDPPLVFLQSRKPIQGIPILAVLPSYTKEIATVTRRAVLDTAVEAINGLIGEGCLIALLSAIHGMISTINAVEQLPRETQSKEDHPSSEKCEKAIQGAQRKAFLGALTGAQPIASSTNADEDEDEDRFVSFSMPTKVELNTVDTSLRATDYTRRNYLSKNEELDGQLKKEWEHLRKNGTFRNAREELPAFKIRDHLREAISKNQVVVIGGETGSGKTTQVPQYLYEFMCEEGMGSSANVLCIQPRRLAATSVALRVAEERDEAVGGVVGYSIRLENCVSRRTQITYCTTGIVLRRLQVDKFLSRVSHVVVDEVHERGVDTDFLLILLRDLINGRSDLKVVLMSATMDSELFARYFGGAPVLSISGRTFPVDVFHLEDIIPMVEYSLEDGSPYAKKGIGKSEYRHNTRKNTFIIDMDEVEDSFDMKDAIQGIATQLNAPQKTLETISRMNLDVINYELIESIVLHIDSTIKIEGSILIFLPGMAEIVRCMEQLKSNPMLSRTSLIYNLHSSLGSAEQQGVFKRPPRGKRKIIIGTNIMETSITIDDAVFVIDSGKYKENRYNAKKNLSQLITVNVAKTNCRQRQGRAGRVREGFCFRLFSSAQFEALDDHQLCEMHRVPLESLILQIYSLNLGDEVEYLQKALSPPEGLAIRSSVKSLTTIGALTYDKRLTSLGKHLANIPLDVRIGKMIIHGAILQCVDPVLTIAACLSVRSPFSSSMDYQVEVEAVRRALAGEHMSDHLVSWFAYVSWITAHHKGRTTAAKKICADLFLLPSTLKQIQSTKQQYERYLVEAGFIEEKSFKSSFNNFLFSPVVTLDDRVYESGGERYNTNSGSVKCILSCIVAGLYPNAAQVKSKPDKKGGTFTRITTFEGSEVLVHPSSVAGKAKNFISPLLVYVDKMQTSAIFLREVSMVTSLQVILFSGGGLEYLPKYGELIVDGMAAFKCQSEEAALLKHLKNQLDSALRLKINDPTQSWESASSVVVRAILKLLKDDLHTTRNLTIVDPRQPRELLAAPSAPIETVDSTWREAKRSCHVCGEKDHLARDCPRKEAKRNGGTSVRCFICGDWHHPTVCMLAAPI